MDFVNEENVAWAEFIKQGQQITRSFNGRPTGRVEPYPHLIGDDHGHGGLTQAWWPIEQDMVQGLFPLLGGLNIDGDFVFNFGLTNVFRQATWSQTE